VQGPLKKKPRRVAGALDSESMGEMLHHLGLASFGFGVPHPTSLNACMVCLSSRHVGRQSGPGKGERKPQSDNHRDEFCHR
jgi:hypothetical protein